MYIYMIKYHHYGNHYYQSQPVIRHSNKEQSLLDI